MLPVHDSVDVPELLAIVVALKVHDKLVELVVTARMTIPMKPFAGATVMVEAPATPTLIVTIVGLAVTVKS